MPRTLGSVHLDDVFPAVELIGDVEFLHDHKPNCMSVGLSHW